MALSKRKLIPAKLRGGVPPMRKGNYTNGHSANGNGTSAHTQEVLPPRSNKAGPIASATMRRSRDIADYLASDGGVLPLHCFADSYRFYYGEVQELTRLYLEAKAQHGRTHAITEKARKAMNNMRIYMLESAKEGAPYQHPKLQTAVIKGDAEAPLKLIFASYEEDI